MQERCNRVELSLGESRVQASLILAQVCRAVSFVWLEDLCIFPIKATCNSNELEDINLRAVNPKKNRRQRAENGEKECGTSEVQQKATKNQRDAKEADKKKQGKCQAN